MIVDQNEFFREMTLRICGHLDIEKAMQSFPKGKYPKTVEEYDEIMEKHEDELEFLDDDELDSLYMGSPENIEGLVVDFVKDNYEKFAP